MLFFSSQDDHLVDLNGEDDATTQPFVCSQEPTPMDHEEYAEKTPSLQLHNVAKGNGDGLCLSDEEEVITVTPTVNRSTTQAENSR